jgi:hypothetical protein
MRKAKKVYGIFGFDKKAGISLYIRDPCFKIDVLDTDF